MVVCLINLAGTFQKPNLSKYLSHFGVINGEVDLIKVL